MKAGVTSVAEGPPEAVALKNIVGAYRSPALMDLSELVAN